MQKIYVCTFLNMNKPYFFLFTSHMTNKKENINPKVKLIEGLDFHIERGFYVFTEHYLLKRGYCCENGCRNCPYRGANKTSVTRKNENEK
jgi:Family of unknown function (DUF5522)